VWLELALSWLVDYEIPHVSEDSASPVQKLTAAISKEYIAMVRPQVGTSTQAQNVSLLSSNNSNMSFFTLWGSASDNVLRITKRVVGGYWMGRSFGWDRKNWDPVSQQVWHDKDPSLWSAGHRPKFYSPSLWRDPYRTTPAVTQVLGFYDFIQRTVPINRLLRQVRKCGGLTYFSFWTIHTNGLDTSSYNLMILSNILLYNLLKYT
jgi:hypothetical protein